MFWQRYVIDKILSANRKPTSFNEFNDLPL